MKNNIIAAQCTATGKAGIGIIRLSGQGSLALSFKIFEPIFQPLSIDTITPNHMYLGSIFASDAKDLGYMVYFAAPNSFTGEEVVEFHCHGGQAILDAVLNNLYSQGAAPAARGEFSKRAYLNGKLSLSQAEGIADMINADSTATLNAAYKLMSGELSQTVYKMQTKILELIASVEATLDFEEELSDTPPLCKKALDDLIVEGQKILKNSENRRMLTKGADIALIGRPNTGKSSLLNKILRYDRSIVTPIAGTTRDTVEESVEVDGVKLNFIDTAGLIATSANAAGLTSDKSIACADTQQLGYCATYPTDYDPNNKKNPPSTKDSAAYIEQLGIKRSIDAASVADVTLLIFDATTLSTSPQDDLQPFASLLNNHSKYLAVINKIDLVDKLQLKELKSKLPPAFLQAAQKLCSVKTFEFVDFCFISAKNGEGVDALVENIAAILKKTVPENSLLLTRCRHINALKSAVDNLKQASNDVSQNISPECLAVSLKSAWQSLGEITGSTATEEIVNHIFDTFCIGK